MNMRFPPDAFHEKGSIKGVCNQWYHWPIWNFSAFPVPPSLFCLVPRCAVASPDNVLVKLICQRQLILFGMCIDSLGRQSLVSRLNYPLGAGSDPWLKKGKRKHPVEIAQMMNSYSQRDLIAFEAGETTEMRWLATPKNKINTCTQASCPRCREWMRARRGSSASQSL